jgi:YD repeat-containing protein
MRRHRYSVPLALTAFLCACSGDSGTTSPTPPTPPGTTVLLREVVLSRLPSPYYQFTYDAAGRITTASFAAGTRVYDVSYEGDRISEMRNDALGNHDRLAYAYDGAGRVAGVSYIDSNGQVFTRVSFTYLGQKLTGVERQRKLGTDFVVDKTTTLSYYADGNLLQITVHRPAIDGQQTETTTVDRFEQYDDKVNVDGFGLIHDDFFDHLVLLPGVQLQKGNPAKETFSGGALDFTVDYTYTYDDRGRPLAKIGAAKFLTGPDAGRSFEVRSDFSYF